MNGPSRPIEISFPSAEVSRAASAALERKELKDPINHAHRWWGRRPAVVMDAVVRASLGASGDAATPGGSCVLDPMMGGGTTIAVARALGLRAIGQDINPVAYRIVSALHGRIDVEEAEATFSAICEKVAREVGHWYFQEDSSELICNLWALEVPCPRCGLKVAAKTQVLVGTFHHLRQTRALFCLKCLRFREKTQGICGCGASNSRVGAGRCDCGHDFKLASAARAGGFSYRLAVRVVREGRSRRYLPPTELDLRRVAEVDPYLPRVDPYLPTSSIRPSETSAQLLGWGCRRWRDLYLPRQAVVLGLLAREFCQVEEPLRNLFALALSTAAEFNSAMCSYRGEGQGAIRPAFWAQFLRLEPVVAEAPLLAAPPVSGSIRSLFKNRLLRALRLAAELPGTADFRLGSSHQIDLPDQSVDAVVTDPPFSDSVNYDDLADYFNAWHQVLYPQLPETTKSPHQVQDSAPQGFASNLGAVLRECRRVMKPGAVAAFTFTHKDPRMWAALAEAAEQAQLRIVRSHAVLTDASYSMINYSVGARSRTNAVLVFRKTAELPASLRSTVSSVAAEAAEEAAAQLASLSTLLDFKPSEGDVLTAVYGCAASRLASLPSSCWVEACEKAREVYVPISAIQKGAEAPPQLSLF